MSEIDELYTDIIMEHSTDTRHKHEIINETCSAHGHNPNCGDDITLHIKLDNDKIEDLTFSGSGCAISQSSTSVMIDTLKGKTIAEAKQIANIFVKMIDRELISVEEEKLLKEAVAFKNISNMPARVKCALLSWKTLKQKLDELNNINF